MDIEGKVVAQLAASTSAGLHKVNWMLTSGDLRETGRQPGRQPGGQRPRTGRGGGGGAGGPQGGRLVANGTYRVVLTVDGKEFIQSVRIEADPNATTPSIAEEKDSSTDVID